MLWNWQRGGDLIFVRHTYGPNPSVNRHGGDHLSFQGAKEEEGVRDSSQLQTLRSELDVRLSCSAGGSDLTWSAPSEACACFYDCP